MAYARCSARGCPQLPMERIRSHPLDRHSCAGLTHRAEAPRLRPPRRRHGERGSAAPTMDAERRLCMLLVGLTELRRCLSMAVHESLSQRLVVRHHIGSLGRDELDDLLGHRLRLAGSERPLFEPPAVEALFQASRGLPRQINRIANTPCPPPRSPRNAPSTPSTCSTPSTNSGPERKTAASRHRRANAAPSPQSPCRPSARCPQAPIPAGSMRGIPQSTVRNRLGNVRWIYVRDNTRFQRHTGRQHRLQYVSRRLHGWPQPGRRVPRSLQRGRGLHQHHGSRHMAQHLE